jgi:hypothetical protein
MQAPPIQRWRRYQFVPVAAMLGRSLKCRAHATARTRIYLHSGEGYKLALHEKYASLHPMKIVKQGMPSLTGQFEINTVKMETTVYDWDGKAYKPSLCATVIKGKKIPSITRHPCKALSQ